MVANGSVLEKIGDGEYRLTDLQSGDTYIITGISIDILQQVLTKLGIRYDEALRKED